MSEETPKYTIALDLDPWGIIRAGADPVYEHQIYKIRVQSGLVIDMGFTLEDFKQHIAGLAEKLPSKSQIVNPFVSAVRDALARENWYAALALALTLPDICADLEKPKRGVGTRYTQWWNTYLSRKYNGALSGDDCYSSDVPFSIKVLAIFALFFQIRVDDFGHTATELMAYFSYKLTSFASTSARVSNDGNRRSYRKTPRFKNGRIKCS